MTQADLQRRIRQVETTVGPAGTAGADVILTVILAKACGTENVSLKQMTRALSIYDTATAMLGGRFSTLFRDELPSMPTELLAARSQTYDALTDSRQELLTLARDLHQPEIAFDACLKAARQQQEVVRPSIVAMMDQFARYLEAQRG